MALLATLLKSREKAIQAALDAAKDHFAVIGTHLAAIRDDKLYKDQFETFDAYVLERWEFTRQYAYRLISSAKTLEDLSTAVDKGTPLPTTERQVREIEKAEPEERAEVWQTAQEIAGTEQPSAPVIQRAAEIVTTGKPANHESIEIDEAIESMSKAVDKFLKIGQRVQLAFEGKQAVCQAMASRKAKFEKLVSGTAGQAELLKEHVDCLAKAWTSTKRQVDE